MTDGPPNVRKQYRAIAEVVRQYTEKQIKEAPEIIGAVVDYHLIRYDSIDHNALKKMEEWSSSDFRKQWRDVPRRGRGHPKAISLSLWHDQTLCGLCFATPKKSKVRIKLMLLEGHPDEQHPLKGLVASLMLVAIENYARLIGLEKILIPEPLPGAVPLYKELGFDYDADNQLVKAV